MFSITGRLTNIFEQPGGQGKDGKAYPAISKAQIMGNVVLKNGEKRIELLTLSVPPNRLPELKACLNTDVTLPCGIFVSGGRITPFLTG